MLCSTPPPGLVKIDEHKSQKRNYKDVFAAAVVVVSDATVCM